MTDDARLLWLVSALVVAGAALAAWAGFVEIDLRELAPGDIGTLLLTLIFTALVIERAVEVYANTRFDPERARISMRADGIAEGIKLKERSLDAEEARPNRDEAEIRRLRDTLSEARRDLLGERQRIRPELAQLRQRKANYAATLATVFALGAAVVGVRVLGQVLPADPGEIVAGLVARGTEEAAAEVQLAALRFVDVVLTTALLAGGADGIHHVIKRFTDIRAEP